MWFGLYKLIKVLSLLVVVSWLVTFFIALLQQCPIIEFFGKECRASDGMLMLIPFYTAPFAALALFMLGILGLISMTRKWLEGGS